LGAWSPSPQDRDREKKKKNSKKKKEKNGMSQGRTPCHRGKQVHGKAVESFPFECPKLVLDPGQGVLREDLGRSGGDRAPACELGAKRPDCAAKLCQAILVLEDVLDAGAKPILGRSSFVPSLPLRGQLRQLSSTIGLANLVWS